MIEIVIDVKILIMIERIIENDLKNILFYKVLFVYILKGVLLVVF